MLDRRSRGIVFKSYDEYLQTFPQFLIHHVRTRRRSTVGHVARELLEEIALLYNPEGI